MENQKPYLIREIVIKNKEYNPEYGDDKKCRCGHPYYRHFDSYEDMRDVGCKYCDCTEFIPFDLQLKDENVIFVITTLKHALTAGSRSVGYAKTLVEADEWVRNNACDINEDGYYKYTVIEAIEPGIYSHPKKEFWYKWNNEKEEYETCGKPARFKQVVSFGLG